MKTILAVDDNPTNLTLVRETLKDLYKVVLVTSGDQAIKFLEKKQADLVLLDICMPGMDGIETLKEMNKLENGPWKVILLTALAEMDTVEEGKALGAIGMLPKPFIPQEMLDTVKNAIGE